MRCANCDREFDETAGDCPYCGAVPEQNIKKARPDVDADREAFGETREDASSKRGGVYVRHIKTSGFMSQLIFIIFILFVVFIFLPMFILAAFALAIVWFIWRFIRSF